MKRKQRWVYGMALAMLLAASPVWAAGPLPPADLSARIGEVEFSNFPRISAPITVRDANGVPVPDLEADAFEINEDRAAEARPIVGIEQAVNPEIPVGLVLVIDVSGSMAGQPLADAKTAAQALLNQLDAEDEIGVLAFADTVDLDAPDPAREHVPTQDHAALATLVDSLKAEGGTPLYDALYKAVLWTEAADLGHRAVILLTDGVDEGPGSRVASAETPIQEATRANVPVFTIALGNEIDRGYLERVARTTGGFFQETPDSAELPQLFLNVLDRLKQQYVVTYESGLEGDGKTHRVQVTVRVGGRQASDEAEFGPLPLIEIPDATLTPTPSPIATATASPTPHPTDTPMATHESVAEPESEEGNGFGLGNLLAGLAAVLVIVGIVIAVVVRRHRAAQVKQSVNQEYCLSCGRALAEGQVCPDCGPDAGRFKKPRL